MRVHIDKTQRAIPLTLGGLTLVSVMVLLIWDVLPGMFPSGAHNLLGAIPLGLIGVAYLIYQTIRRPGRAETIKSILLAMAFFFWAANQLWPESPRATLYNDLAIALFVLDVFFVLAGWPSSSPDESFAECYTEAARDKQ